MTERGDLLISIVVPTYNEAEDIRRTLDALVGQTYAAREIIVVDDASTDETAAIVSEYRDRGVQLIRHPSRQERSAARNAGIRAARGDVVVILNADVFPNPDFLSRIASHYWGGADYVLVESQIANTAHLFPRYMEALHQHTYGGRDWIEWTEGFSCRRDAAIDVGLFPETPVPLCSGEDAYFGFQLARKYKKVIDRTIVVPHIMPERFENFWRQQVSRGQATPRYRFFLDHRSAGVLAARAFAKTLRTLVSIVLVFPMVVFCWRLTRRSPHGIRDLPGFCLVYVLSRLGHAFGEWCGIRDIVRYQRQTRVRPLSPGRA